MQKPEVVVITGASAGVGRATVREFAQRGAHIGLLARDRERLEETRREVEAMGGRALVVPTDVANPDEVEAAAQAVEEEFGPIDIWINNAMTAVFSPVHQMLPEEYARVMEVTYLGQVYGALAALRRMLPRDRGKIVFVGSALAYRGIPLQSSYSAAKHAVEGFFDSLRSELLHDNSSVEISLVNLPGLNTPQFQWVRSRMPNMPQPVPPFFQPEVAARAIYWTAHHPRARTSVARNTVWVMMLNKFFPGLGDRYLARTNYQAQQTNQPRDPNRPDNLFDTVPGDYGAHGPFDRRAKTSSWQWWANTHRGALALTITAIAGALGALLYWRSET